MKTFVLINHQITDEQVADLRRIMGYSGDIINLTDDPEIKAFWANIDPDALISNIDFHCIQIWNKINELGGIQDGDLFFIQGEAGATFNMVETLINIGAIPVYATTKRESVEVVKDGVVTIKTNVFKHVRFRAYNREHDNMLIEGMLWRHYNEKL